VSVAPALRELEFLAEDHIGAFARRDVRRLPVQRIGPGVGARITRAHMEAAVFAGEAQIEAFDLHEEAAVHTHTHAVILASVTRAATTRVLHLDDG